MNGADVGTGGGAGGTGVAVVADDHDRGGSASSGPGRGRHGAGGRGRLTAGLRRRLVERRIRIRRTRGRRLRRALVVLLALLANLVGAAVVAYHLTKIPEPHPETAMQSTVFVDDHGDYLGRRGPVDRQEIPLSPVRYVQEAVIAAGDQHPHGRRYPEGDGPACRSTVGGGDQQGDCTITQQYVKNALLSPQQSLSRKAREALISIKLDRTRSKDEILQGYLNTVYFGRGAPASGPRQELLQHRRQGPHGEPGRGARVRHQHSLVLREGRLRPEGDGQAGGPLGVGAGRDGAHGAITSAQRAGARFPAFRFYPPGDTDGQRQYLIDAAAWRPPTGSASPRTSSPAVVTPSPSTLT